MTALETHFFLSSADAKEFKSIILSFNNNKSVGPYSIHIEFLKILASQISESFSLIVNDSFCKGSYAGNLKIGKLVALHKKESTDNPSNYPSISLPFSL